ncbi:MAG: hypothetical protein HZB26_05790 [Candidatus Hydrogenedentes bacterium]|nr:hypothetical protein [Candidatus Hydrogenedentota bacterium]
MEQRREDFRIAWEQDQDTIGRVLRSLLVVEHFLTEHIRAKNPALGDVDAARLTFVQKVGLIGENDYIGIQLRPGLLRLNTVRNRLAHNLHEKVSIADRDVFLSVYFYKALRTEGQKRFGPEPDDPLSILEDFSKFAAGIFQSSASPDTEYWRKAQQALEEEAANNDRE